MEPMTNIALLIICFNVAWALTKLYVYFDRCYRNYQIKKQRKNELFQKRVEKLQDNAIDYYYTLAINNPFKLSCELAAQQIDRVKRENKVVELYSKLRGAC